jgi:pilus assembly protein FimV
MPPNVLQLARQGDTDAIAALMNRHLQAKGITAHVTQHDQALQVILDSEQVPDATTWADYVKKGITGLGLSDMHPPDHQRSATWLH